MTAFSPPSLAFVPSGLTAPATTCGETVTCHLPDRPRSRAAPSDYESPQPRCDGASGLSLESGAADLQAQWRGARAVDFDERINRPQHPQWVSGVGRIALEQCRRMTDSEVSRVRLNSSLSYRLSPTPPIWPLQCYLPTIFWRHTVSRGLHFI